MMVLAPLQARVEEKTTKQMKLKDGLFSATIL